MLVKWHFLLGTHKLLDPVSKTTFFVLIVVDYCLIDFIDKYTMIAFLIAGAMNVTFSWKNILRKSFGRTWKDWGGVPMVIAPKY